MKRRPTRLLILGALLLATLAACSSPSPVSTDGGTPAPAAVTAKPTADASPQEPPQNEIVEITAVLQLSAETVLDNNPVVQAIEDATGIRMLIEAPPSTGYGDRVKMMVGTGDMPDLLHYGADVFAQQWASEGLLLDITDMIADYENLSKNITKEQYGDCIFLPDGRIYGVPRPNSYDYWGYLVNKKWLDNLGLDAPKTIDDYIAVSRAFTFDDPDQNGQADTFGGGLHGGPWHLQNDFVSMAYSISGWHHGMPDADGSAKLRAFKSMHDDYLTLLRDMYDEGILDREFITHKASENADKFAQQRVGFLGVSGKGFTGTLEKYNLDPDDYMYCPPLVLSSGDTPKYAMPPSCWMAYYINAKSDKAQDVLRLLDYCNSQDGFVLMQFGIAGEHYNSYDIETRTIDRTDAQRKELESVTSGMFAFANAFAGKPAIEGGSTPALTEKWRKEAGAADAVTIKCYFGFTKMIDKVSVEFPDDADALSTLEVRYITGEIPLEEMQNFINGDYKTKTAAIAQELVDYMAANPPRDVR